VKGEGRHKQSRTGPERWSSKLGFYLAAPGAAVGLGSIWRFPYLTGTNGGSAFVFVFILACLAIATPLLVAEFIIGRRSRRKLVPADLEQRAQLNRWLLFTATELEQPLWRITRHTNLYPEARRLPGDVALAREEFTSMAGVLDEHMRGRQFVIGNTVTVADFVLAYTLDWANEVHLLDGFPPLRAYMERMYARPHAPLRIAEAFARMQTVRT
jgi:glutathione S-transferase